MKITTRTDAIKIKGVKYYQGKRLFDAGLLKEDQPVNLCPQPENPHDSNAVAVKTISDEMLGHVSRRIAAKYQALAIYDQVHSSKIKSISVVSGYEVLDIRVLVTYSHVSHEYECEIPITPGVYEIKLGSDFSYIGSTKNLKKRCSQHLSQLNSNIHVNKNIQNDFNKYGLDSFQFSILETTNDHDTALKLEEKIINEYFYCGKKLYNKTLDGRGISNPREPSNNNNGNLIDRENLAKGTDNPTLQEAPKNSIPLSDSNQDADERLYEGEKIFQSGDKYVGEFLNDKPHGFGSFYFTNGDFYEGEIENGKAHGKGKIIFNNEDVYVGNFQHNKRTGSGTFYWKDGTIYQGDFVDGEITGKGMYKWTNGDILEGEFKDGRRLKSEFTRGS